LILQTSPLMALLAFPPQTAQLLLGMIGQNQLLHHRNYTR
jgi:hypothetical protein